LTSTSNLRDAGNLNCNYPLLMTKGCAPCCSHVSHHNRAHHGMAEWYLIYGCHLCARDVLERSGGTTYFVLALPEVLGDPKDQSRLPQLDPKCTPRMGHPSAPIHLGDLSLIGGKPGARFPWGHEFCARNRLAQTTCLCERTRGAPFPVSLTTTHYKISSLD
jgi:hypothetical protein